MVTAYFRVGLLAVVIEHGVLYVLYQMPMGTDLTAWHSAYMIAAVALLLAIAAWAFRTSLAGKELFALSLLDE